MSTPATRPCDAYITKTVTMARGQQRYRQCIQPATQEREYTTISVAGRSTRKVHLCPRHVGMFDKGQTGILESRA